MKILINTSNLKAGGGLQVADSICRYLEKIPQHKFIVVLSNKLLYLENILDKFDNTKCFNYSQKIGLKNVVSGRDNFLDELVEKQNIEAVLTIFGPSRWRPKCFHLCGFAMPHIALNDSPYWKQMSKIEFLKTKLRVMLMTRDFRVNGDELWCENEFITGRLKKIFKNKKNIHTITNNYNQVFDDTSMWNDSIQLPPFNGISLLTVTANYPHKNLSIALQAYDELKKLDADINVRFIFTINPNQFVPIPAKYKENFVFLGPITIDQCPPLYSQADIIFQPSLLECFSATYAEAMKMRVPIITTDLGFAHSLCGDAALYYSALDPKDLAQTIIRLVDDVQLRNKIVKNGQMQLRKFDSTQTRVNKLISIIENHT